MTTDEQLIEPKVKIKLSKATTAGGNVGWDITMAEGATEEEATRLWKLAMRVHEAMETAFMPVVDFEKRVEGGSDA